MAARLPLLPPAAVETPAHVRVVLVGNPNTGKTTVFNQLCGARAKTANFPGTTTQTRTGRSRLSDRRTAEILDLPGLYALRFDGLEARIVTEVLEARPDDRCLTSVVVVVDAANLSRNLVLVGELLSRGESVIVALNMMDLAKRRGLTVDADALSRGIGVPVVPMVASKGHGLDALRTAIDEVTAGGVLTGSAVESANGVVSPDPAAWAHAVARAVTAGPVQAVSVEDGLTARLDRIFTHPLLGVIVFVGVMGGLFWSLFALARVPMRLIDAIFAQLGGLVIRFVPDGPIRALLADGIVGGIAGTAVFLPQICLLFFLISLLEDTGYLARAAFVNDRFFQRFGLPGYAFVPLLTAHACAVPGIMSARLISDRRDRLATILVAPLMSCSARLPVYVLFTSLLFATRPALAGWAFASCYLLGTTAALLSAFAFGKTILGGAARPMVLELPTYKLPSLTNALLAAKDQGLAFLRTAGTIIMAICVVMWWLSAYPKAGTPIEAQALRVEAQRDGLSAERVHALTVRADLLQARVQQRESFAGRVGRTIEPAFRPLGFDWQLTVGVLTSFVAREVFVSTMSVLADGDRGEGVVTHIRTMTRGDGTALFTPATSASALIFFILAMQCLPTLAVTHRETGRLKYPIVQLGYMTTLAYGAAFLTYQGLRLAGVS